MNIQTPCYIVSVYRKGLSNHTNFETHERVKDQLNDSIHKFKELQGTYNGQEELSFLVFVEELAEFLALGYDQESYLALDSNRHGILVFLNEDKTISLGKLKISTTKPDCDFSYDGEYYYYYF